MESVIVVCLLIIIALLLHDKIISNKPKKKSQRAEKVNPNLPDIMGQPRVLTSQFLPNTATENQITEREAPISNLDIEYDENEVVAIPIPQEELDEVFRNMPDLREVEDDLIRQEITGNESSFSQGVTYDELSTVGAWLQEENLEQAQKETAIVIVRKLQGTELFNLLENSVEGASRKIAKLLDSTLSSETEPGSSTLRKSDLEDFDIGEFV